MAKALHPNLMPLLSKLHQEVTDPALDFYTTFFTSFIQGWFVCVRIYACTLGLDDSLILSFIEF